MNVNAPGEKPKLLYVDDERPNLTAFRVLLRDTYNVLTAENAEEAYILLKQHDIPLVVSDQRMPGMTGTELLQKVAEDFPDCARMILTGYSDIDAVIEGINRSQIYYYFKKPWNENEVRLTLNNALQYVMTRRSLVESEQRFRSTFEQAGLGIAHLNPDGTVVRVNSQLLSFLGIIEQELAGQPITRWFTEISTFELSAIAAGDLEKIVKETSVPTQLGNRWSRVALTAIIGKNTIADYLILIVDDLTERKLLETERDELQEHLRQSQKLEAIGSLAGGVAHDFNNLLTPIIVYAEMIEQKFSDNESFKSKAQSITKAALSAKQLTSQLLSFSRKQVLEMKPCNMNEVISSFLDILRRTIRENIIIDVKLAPQNLCVMADKDQLVQIVLNLIVNAQDAITGNGTVAIETSEVMMDNEIARIHPGMVPGRYVQLVVTDNGCGMDDETLSHIFEPFYTTKLSGHGTGLGLATVYGIIKQHDGFIGVTSRPGYGTAFKLYLPLNTFLDKEPEISLKNSPNDQSGSGTILVVEDNDMVREMLTEILSGTGYRIHVASTPGEALDIARKISGEISLLLTDMVMPDMNGMELFEQLSAEFPAMKVMYISGYTSNVSVHAGVLEEGVNFLPKPFTSKQLLDRIKKLL